MKIVLAFTAAAGPVFALLDHNNSWWCLAGVTDEDSLHRLNQ